MTDKKSGGVQLVATQKRATPRHPVHSLRLAEPARHPASTRQDGDRHCVPLAATRISGIIALPRMPDIYSAWSCSARGTMPVPARHGIAEAHMLWTVSSVPLSRAGDVVESGDLDSRGSTPRGGTVNEEGGSTGARTRDRRAPTPR